MIMLANLVEKIRFGNKLDEQEEMIANMTLEKIFNLKPKQTWTIKKPTQCT